jgi:hypothetical protein
VNADVAAYDPLNFRVEFGREHKDGSRPFFGSFGLDNTVEIPEPIDYDTTEVKFIGEYAKKPFYVNVSYYFSLFENNTDEDSPQDPGLCHCRLGLDDPG